jgi:hypothetical protein
MAEAKNKSGTLRMEYVDINKIEANSWNPQEMSKIEFERLKKEIAEVGFIVPIQVVPLENGNFRILGGEHRWSAAKEIGMTEIPCSILLGPKWEDEDLSKFVTVRLNLISGKLDPVKFATLYDEMAQKYGQEALSELMGFTDAKAMAKVLGGVKKELKKVLPKSMHGAVDAATKEAKSINDLGNIVQMLFSKYGDTVNQSFMIFTYGTQEHLYLSMSPEVKTSMDTVVEFCRTTGQDLNTVLGPSLEALSKNLDIPKKKPASDDVEF